MKDNLSEQELEYLKQIHNAQAIRELTRQPGWEIYTGFVANLVERFENQHLGFADAADAIPSRDAYWVSGVRLGGIRQFAKILTEQIAKEVDFLKQPLRPPKPPDPIEFDGEIRNGQQAEGDE